MSIKPAKVLYAKFNSARRPEFRVTTEICEDEGGRFVRKQASEEVAKAHLRNILAIIFSEILYNRYSYIHAIISNQSLHSLVVRRRISTINLDCHFIDDYIWNLSF